MGVGMPCSFRGDGWLLCAEVDFDQVGQLVLAPSRDPGCGWTRGFGPFGLSAVCVLDLKRGMLLLPFFPGRLLGVDLAPGQEAVFELSRPNLAHTVPASARTNSSIKR